MTRDPRMVSVRNQVNLRQERNFNLVKDNIIKRTRVRGLVSKVWRPNIATSYLLIKVKQ